MKTLSIRLLLCAAVACAIACTNVTDKPEISIDYLKLRRALDSARRPFDPAFFKQQHMALIFEIDSVIDTSSVTIITKIGKMPTEFYPGSFEVIYKDSLDQDLGRYKMWSPFYQRVESAGDSRGIRKVYKGRFQVPLPRDPRISQVLMRDGTEGSYTVANVKLFFKHL
jgi:hypothetical protein